MKNWTVEKKDSIESMLINMFASIGMDIPENYEDIVQYCYEDVCETADPENWHSGDVTIAFRRWIESNTTNVQPNDEATAQAFLRNYFRGSGYSNEIDYIRCMVAYANNRAANVQPKQESIAVKLQKYIDTIGEEAFQEEWIKFDKEWTAEHGEEIVHKLYFDIVALGYDEELQREQIQIHAGENGNVFLIKTDDGFIVDVYNQSENINTMAIWEEDLTPDDEDDSDVIFDFPYSKVMAFIKKWGRSEEEVFIELELDADMENVNDAMCEAYFWEDTNKVWIPKLFPSYTEEEQAIADYLQQPVT